jgi:hypothetical protein
MVKDKRHPDGCLFDYLYKVKNCGLPLHIYKKPEYTYEIQA